MTKKLTVALTAGVSVIVTLAAVGLIWRVGLIGPFQPAVVPAPQPAVNAPAPPAAGTSVAQPTEVQLPGTPAELVTPPAVPEEPLPPVVVRPKNALGLERVEFNPSIGDIYRIVYDRPSDYLFMAVVEPTGMRSIWRMGKDLKAERVLQENQRLGEIFLGEDSHGNIYAHFADPGSLYRTADLGQTWQKVADGIDGAFWQIADDGKGTVWGALHAWNQAIVFRSTDDGVTWKAWKDFQRLYPEYAVPYAAGDNRYKLRHLHSIAYLNGKLFVGTGDWARFTYMSADGGDTWQQVWDEGFTAGVPLADRTGLLMGPDRLKAHGLALYDDRTGKTTEVWNPAPYGYSGYTYSLLDIAGSYFAAFHNESTNVGDFVGRSGIIVSPNGRKWYPFLEFDKLTNEARTDIFMSSAGDWNGFVTLSGALYRFEPPIGRWYEIHKAFGAK